MAQYGIYHIYKDYFCVNKEMKLYQFDTALEAEQFAERSRYNLVESDLDVRVITEAYKPLGYIQ